MAHAYVDAVAEAGADAIKFQTHIAAAESSPAEPWRVQFSYQDATRYDYWKRMEFTEQQWAGLREHARKRGLLFLSSPFSFRAIELLERVGVAAWKVASGEVSSCSLLERMCETGVPILLSSGMSPFSELDLAVERIRSRRVPLWVLQCTSCYPCPPERVGLNVISELRERYSCGVGLSDHSGTIFPSLSAGTLGADVVEVHVTMSREMFGPDVRSSITTAELRQLVQGLRFIEAMRANPIDKDLLAEEMQPLRATFTKSVFLTQDLPAGTVIAPDHLECKKPGTGIPASRLPELLGRTLARPVAAGTMLDERDLD